MQGPAPHRNLLAASTMFFFAALFARVFAPFLSPVVSSIPFAIPPMVVFEAPVVGTPVARDVRAAFVVRLDPIGVFVRRTRSRFLGGGGPGTRGRFERLRTTLIGRSGSLGLATFRH